MADSKAPIELDFKTASPFGSISDVSLRTFTSYSFSRNILIPASPFRFTAPGLDKNLRLSIRSGDTVGLYVVPQKTGKQQLAMGFVDETDTHIMGSQSDYVITGRDTIGQLVDNTAVDASNKIQNTENLTLGGILSLLIRNTRIPAAFDTQQIPNGQLLFQTNPGETKIAALQRYLDFTNCLVWSQPNGQLVLGKPDFTQNPYPTSLCLSSTNPSGNNVIEGRVRRNVNQAIRQIVYQLQTLGQVNPAAYTKSNNDSDMLNVAYALVGKSVYSTFSYGQGNDVVNQLTQVGNQSGSPQGIGDNMALREIARENMKILDVELVAIGHINPDGDVYDIDDIYNVVIDDENVEEPMYVYNVDYEMTIQHGLITRLRLCRLGTICAYSDALRRKS